MATDPFIAHDPLICGISMSTADPLTCGEHGSIGCFVTVAGVAASPHPTIPLLTLTQVAAGDYLLTCKHVVVTAQYQVQNQVVQPGGILQAEVAANTIGTYVAGYDYLNYGVDVALVAVNERGMLNAVPNAPWVLGRTVIDTIGTAAVGDIVYKFGATTRYTTGVVTNVNWNSPDGSIVDAIVIQGENGGIWSNAGDSGSIVVRKSDNAAVGLNFRVNNATGDTTNGFTEGFAFDLNRMLGFFGGGQLYAAPFIYTPDTSVDDQI